jgi:GNAT superfamily N-acetyltransferase
MAQPPAARIKLKSGRQATLRPLEAGDAPALGRYFLNLGETTRLFYGPHDFDQATADRLCASAGERDTIVRMVATVSDDRGESIIAYLLLSLGVSGGDYDRYAALGMPLDHQTDCSVGPSVADEYQNQGVGTAIFEQLFASLRSMGYRRMILMGGVRAPNSRGRHFYGKVGFRTVGEFRTPGFDNYDMIKQL